MNEIGEILKEARIEKGYTLDDLQQTTKIQKRYLQAIEDGNTEILPGRFYARAFVKQYADIVGLDGEKLLEEHLNETSKEASEEFAENVTVAPTRSTQTKRGTGARSFQENLPTVLIIFLVIAIFSVIYYAWRQADNGKESLINEDNTEQAPPLTEENGEGAETPADTEDEGTEDSDNTEETEDPADTDEPEANDQEIEIAQSTGVATTYEVTGTAPEEQTIVLEATGGNSWVSVSVDGVQMQQTTLTDGQTLEVNFGADASQINIIVGNASATTIRLNDAELEYAPEAAGVVRQDLTIQFNQ